MDAISQRIFDAARAGTAANPQGVPHTLAALMVAQAKHETGNYTSNFFRNYNNAFGYAYYAGSLYQSGAGTIADNGSPIAAYPNVEASTMEIVDWIWRRYRQGRFPSPEAIITPEAYAAALKAAGYYGDSLENYLAGLRRFFVPVAAVSGAGFLAVLAALWFARHKKWI
jgi:hypothetical protein